MVIIHKGLSHTKKSKKVNTLSITQHS